MVIDRLMALGRDIDKEQLKWVVLMVLFAQPGQETAFSRMEDLVFEESAGACIEVSRCKYQRRDAAASVAA